MRTNWSNEELREALNANPGLKALNPTLSTGNRQGNVDSSNRGMGTNKYRAQRTWSTLCNRWFASKAEAIRGEELCLMEKSGLLSHLCYQVRFVLNEKPKVSITLDFSYKQRETQYYEDVKGVLTRDFRTKLVWLKQIYNIDVLLTK